MKRSIREFLIGPYTWRGWPKPSETKWEPKRGGGEHDGLGHQNGTVVSAGEVGGDECGDLLPGDESLPLAIGASDLAPGAWMTACSTDEQILAILDLHVLDRRTEACACGFGVWSDGMFWKHVKDTIRAAIARAAAPAGSDERA